ncbi:MAG: protein phosphatase 2C domain-containing protein [bacterium]|jgi:serine/threonine protein phosphatase PrpC
MSPARIRSAALSDPGIIRKNNEDRVYADDTRGIYIVIDGVGGEAGGERAAAIAEEELLARLGRNTGALEERIREGIALAGRRIFEQARRDASLAGMSCVLTVAVVDDGEVVVGHVGDTRLYKLRRGAIEKITRDHSPVGMREDAGEMSEQAAMQHPRRNEIFRDVGSEERAPGDAGFIDIVRVPFEPDAALLLCSDGLTDQVTSAEIARVASRGAGDPARIVRELVQLANDAGGRDNVSVIYVEGPSVAEPAPDTVPTPAVRQSRGPVLLAALAGLVLGAAGAFFGVQYFTPEPEPGRRILTVAPELAAAGGDAYATISAALEAARAGDTVEVRPGTYREQVEMKEGVSLISAAPGEAVIEAVAGVNRPGAAVLAENIASGVLSGFAITVLPDSGVSIGVLVSDSNIDVGGIEVRGAESAGILVRGASRPTIRASSIRDNPGAGILVQDGAAPRLLANILAGNGNRASAPRAGLEVTGTAKPVVIGNAFANNYRDLDWEQPPEELAELRKTNLIAPAPARPRPRHAAAAKETH